MRAERTTYHVQRTTYNVPGNIVALALTLVSLLLMLGAAIGVMVMEGSKRAQEMDRAIGAYYMANAGIEQQLYGIRKENKTLAQVASASSTYPGATKWISTTGFDTPATKTFTTLGQEQLAFVDLFDPDNISSTANADRVTISWQPGADCAAKGYAFPDMEVGTAEWQISGGTITWPTATANYTIWPFSVSPMTVSPLDPAKAYRLRLRPFKCGASNVQVTFWNGAAQINYPGDIVLGSQGTYGRTTQKLTVTMPRQDILSGLFSYTVFSQEALCKKVGSAGTCP